MATLFFSLSKLHQLFLIQTTTTTSSAYTYCYTSAAAISTTCDRKKRSIDDSPIDGKIKKIEKKIFFVNLFFFFSIPDESQYPDMINPSSLIKAHQKLEKLKDQRKRSVPLTKLEELNQVQNLFFFFFVCLSFFSLCL